MLSMLRWIQQERKSAEPFKKTLQACEDRKKLARDENTLPAYYAAWEKFSVDEELKRIDEADEKGDVKVKSSGLITAPSVALHDNRQCITKVREEAKAQDGGEKVRFA